MTCVPYARKESGLKLYGNARTWWHQAEGKYARSQRPRVGAVLVFEQSGNMHAGHVTVVKRVVGKREILVDHANWSGPGIRKGQIHKGVAVLDTSPGNDWSSVRVWYQPAGEFGVRVYPTYGFVHDGVETAEDRAHKGKRDGKHSKAGKAEAAKTMPPLPERKPPIIGPSRGSIFQIAERPDRL